MISDVSRPDEPRELPGAESSADPIQKIEALLAMGLVNEAWRALEELALAARSQPRILGLRARIYLAAGLPEAAAAVARSVRARRT